MNKPIFLSLMVIFSAQVSQADIVTVPYVDTARYLGDWYQISHIPLFFEGGPCACARQRLTATDKIDTIGVYNSCNTGNAKGKLTDISGTAVSNDLQSNSKFTVDFGFPWKGTYWIIGLDADYRYAVVTNNSGDALYILSKTPTLSDDLYNEAVAHAQNQNIDLSNLQMTDHQGCTYPN